jgi:hypothetical protein
MTPYFSLFYISKPNILSVLRIRNVYPGSQILIVPIPDPGSKNSNKREGCKKNLFIPDPDFYPSQIPDPKTATKERGEKNLLS